MYEALIRSLPQNRLALRTYRGPFGPCFCPEEVEILV